MQYVGIYNVDPDHVAHMNSYTLNHLEFKASLNSIAFCMLCETGCTVSNNFKTDSAGIEDLSTIPCFVWSYMYRESRGW